MWRPREYPQHSFQHTEMHQKPGPHPAKRWACSPQPSEAAFSCRLPGVPLDTKAVPGSVAGAQPSSAWTVEAHCCIGYTGILSTLWTVRKGEISPLSPLFHTLLKQSPEAATFGSFLPRRMKAHCVWVHWHFITEEVRGTNREVISICTQSCFKSFF